MAKTHAQTLQQRNARAAQSQRKRREGMRARGRPETVATDYAIVEAVGFLIARQLVSTLSADAEADAKVLAGTMSISIADLKETTLDILVRREGYVRAEAKVALGQRLRSRKDHRKTWFIPSLRPDTAAQQARVDQAAEERAKQGRAAA